MTTTATTAVGVILAGGEGRRMGTDKALVRVGSETMAARVAATLDHVAAEVMVSGRTGTLEGRECVPDAFPGRPGPLNGIATVLARCPAGSAAIVVAVDHVFVRAATLVRLLERCDGTRPVVPVADGVRQVTTAVYPAGLAEAAADVLQRGGSVQALFDQVDHDAVGEEVWRDWGEDGRSWFSADRPSDLAAGLERFGAP